MGFLNSLVSVSKNSKKFKEWEKDDNNKQAQRQALYAKQHLDSETLEKAKAKGKIIMDVVDIMDTHSEDVSENVEESVVPAVQTIPMLATMGIGAGMLKFGLSPAEKAYSDARTAFLEQHENLRKINDEICEQLKDKNLDLNSDLAKIKAKSWFPTELISNKKNIKLFQTTTDETLKSYWDNGLKACYEDFANTPAIKNFSKKLLSMGGIFAALSVATFIATNIIGAKLQVGSSRIARWQSRRDLEDPKYFVQYTPEQIAQAKANLENNSEKQNKNKEVSFTGLGGKFGSKKKDDKTGFIKTMTSLVKDKKAYDEWKQSYNIEDKKVKRPLTKEELDEAQRDQEVIQRITKQINNKAEDYSENMEVAAGVLIGGTPFLGLGVGFAVDKFLDIFKIKDAIKKRGTKKFLKDFANQEDGQKALELINSSFKIVEKNGKKIEKIDFKNLGKNCSNIYEILQKNASGNASKIKLLKQFSNAVMSTNKGVGVYVKVLTTLSTAIAGAVIGLKLQKSAARAGRFKAKQEIQQDPSNFIGYTKEELDSVKDVKAPKKSFGKKVGEYVMFIPNCIKDYLDYQKHKKTVKNQDKALLNELVKLDVSEQQIKEAKELQRKVFTTFESVDDKSQEYSESMETLNEITKPVLPYLGILATVTPIAIGGLVAWKKGPVKFADSITSFFSKHTGFLKGKFAKKYSHEVAQNISKVAENQYVYAVNKAVQESQETTGQLLTGIAQMLRNNDIKFDFANMKPDLIRETCTNYSKNPNAPMFLRRMANNILNSGIKNDEIEKICKNMQNIIGNLPKEEVNEILDELIKVGNESPEKLFEMFNNGSVKNAFLTTGLKKAIAIAGGTYTGLSLLVTYLLESAFASMQKKAGRLGVMEGLEELSAPEYYANMEVNQKDAVVSSNNKTDVYNANISPALQKIINRK